MAVHQRAAVLLVVGRPPVLRMRRDPRAVWLAAPVLAVETATAKHEAEAVLEEPAH